jgi:hypothetical protein
VIAEEGHSIISKKSKNRQKWKQIGVFFVNGFRFKFVIIVNY